LGPGQTCPITPLSCPPEGQDGCGIGRLHVLHNPMTLHNLADLIKIYLCLKSGNSKTIVDQGLDQANDIEIEVICSCLDKDPIEYY
jgi:hypothetical protein